jgi:hypothetical protein
MARNFDLSDPTDLAMLNAEFESFTPEDWQEYIDLSLEPGYKRTLSYDERGCLMAVRKRALYGGYPSPKQILWALNIIDKIEAAKENKANKGTDEETETEEED